jgi:hypothetical protein
VTRLIMPNGPSIVLERQQGADAGAVFNLQVLFNIYSGRGCPLHGLQTRLQDLAARI